MLIIRARTSGGMVPLDVKTFTFPGGELQVTAEVVALHSDVEQIDMVAHLKSAHDIMELLLATDAIRRQVSAPIRLFMPYVPYGRQDRVANDGEALSLKVFCDLINAQRYEQIIISDPHSDVTTALLDRCTAMTANFPAAQAIGLFGDCELVAPDAGARKRCLAIAKATKKPLHYADKVRNTLTGEISHTTVDLGILSPRNANRQLMVIDDICDGGRTFIELAKAIREYGHSGKLALYVTHGIFSKGIEPLLEHYDTIYTKYDWTNSANPRLVVVL